MRVIDLQFREETIDGEETIDELSAHLAEKGLTLEEVLSVANDPPAPQFLGKSSHADDRELMIGRTRGGRLLTVVYALPDDGGVSGYIITAWPSKPGEATRYSSLGGQ